MRHVRSWYVHSLFKYKRADTHKRPKTSFLNAIRVRALTARQCQWLLQRKQRGRRTAGDKRWKFLHSRDLFIEADAAVWGVNRFGANLKGYNLDSKNTSISYHEIKIHMLRNIICKS